ncbi:MAG: hypothetical protein JXQ67_04755 [Campylobacterales bacterium]|nr:hypothetical protein [Campylobacterales bacterium]
MENGLTIALIVTVFVVTYLFLYLYFTSKQKVLEKKLIASLHESESLKKKVESFGVSSKEDVKGSKSTLVIEQTKKIEFLESEVAKQKKRLRELKVIAQNATMAQQHFLSKVTEEITRPLYKVLNDTQTLQKSLKEQSSLNTLTHISVNANHLLQLLTDIVDLSKLQAKSFEVSENIVDVHYLLSSVIKRFASLAEKKSLKLIFEIDEKVPDFLYIDGTKVEQILENLIENAIKYTQEGYVKLNVLVDNVEPTTNTIGVSFYVEDTGAGITQEFQDKVFSVFEHVNQAENESAQTIGLGLAIDKKIALAMGGDITFKSENSKGSVFRFRLSDVEMVLHNESDDSEQKAPDFNLLKEDTKVLLVAEYNKNYETIVESFENSNVTLLAYSDFRDIMPLLQTQKINMILIDVEILTNDEGAVAKVLAGRTGIAVVPLIHSRVKELDFSNTPLTPKGFLKKPISKAELFKVSLRVLNI